MPTRLDPPGPSVPGSAHRDIGRPGWSIAVAGGGVPSLALGLALAGRLGAAVDLRIHDPRAAGSAGGGRAFALSPGSVAMLTTLGAWPAIAPHAWTMTRMRITDGRRDDLIRPDYLTFRPGAEGRAGADRPTRDCDPAASLGVVVEEGWVADALAAAARAAGVQFSAEPIEAAEPHGGAIAVTAGGRVTDAALLVAADGARSRLREAAGIGWVGRPYRQSALVATVSHTRDGSGEAVQHFLPDGPFAILPLVGLGERHPFRSSVVWTAGRAEARQLLADPAAAGRAIAALYGPDYGEVALDGPLRAHPLAVGLARRFVAPRLALLGDAAHEVHPLAGQGLNLGLADAAALAERVADAVRLGLDPGEADVLRGYERDRRPDALLLAGLTDGLNRLFSNDLLPVRALRDFGLGLVDRLPPVKAFLAREAAGTTRRAPRLMRGLPL